MRKVRLKRNRPTRALQNALLSRSARLRDARLSRALSTGRTISAICIRETDYTLVREGEEKCRDRGAHLAYSINLCDSRRL